MKPTAEQSRAIQMFAQGGPVKVIAFAGAGKTSTLTAMAKAMPGKRGLYAAYNRSIKDDAAEKFPRTVQCKTTHGLAWGSLAGEYGEQKLRFGPRADQLEGFLKSSLTELNRPEAMAILKAALQVTLRRFCQGWEEEVTEHHVPRLPGITDKEQETLEEVIPDIAQEVWEAQADPKNALGLGGDGYVKLWALNRPRLRKDYIMVDEAQDLNPVVIGVMKAQDAQIICVGDSHQQIYEWRGARDALRILPGQEGRLTQSFRFGPRIAGIANMVLTAMGEQYPLIGTPSINDAVFLAEGHDYVDAVLCRTNAGVFSRAVDYLDMGRLVYVAGGVNELRSWVEDAGRLVRGLPARSMELMGFVDWAQVEAFAKTEDGRGLVSFVSLVNRFGVDRLGEVLDRILPAPRPGCVTLSTAHKSKGLEWNSVEINEDFWVEKASLAEQRLFYVAITRAKRVLSVSRELVDVYSRAQEVVA
jgi:hypothetical protein